ncbi:hypothetical protein [Lelliottia wanjuensis]|uniref:hypothetical protein n=1 Tax=Lelliottia wanjuensis TaxID=3050585 RepID=UPI00254B3D53|nr:hypothetical protein [Lelliottia sp. V86_10]MDK9586731.1 hypothetical protein [Lelliottia sp. V86_10]
MPNPYDQFDNTNPYDQFDDAHASSASEPESLWSDFKRGAEQLAENYVTAASGFAQRLNNPGEAILHPELVAAGHLDGIHPYSDQIAAPQTITGSLVEALPTFAASIPGTNAALADVETMTLPTLLKWAKKGLAMSIGGDLSSGAQMTPENLAAGTGANMLMEGVFHIPAGLRGVVDRIEGNNADVLAAADRLGVPLTVGNVTRRPWLQTMEAAVSKMPGARAISDTYKKQLEILGQIIDRARDSMGYEGDVNQLGAGIKQSVEQYLADFKKDSGDLYEAIYNKINPIQKINTTQFSALIQQLAEQYKGSGLEEFLDSPIIKKLSKATKQMEGGKTAGGFKQNVMQLRHARALLNRISEAIDKPDSAFKGISDSELLRLRGALSEDISHAFTARNLGKQWQSVQDHYAAGRALYEQALKSVDLSANADNVYTQLFGNASGAMKPMNLTTARALKEVVSPAQWGKISGEVLERMGQEGAGAAGAGGRQFSPATFLTNWNKLTPEVRAELFGVEHAQTLDDVVKVVDALKASGAQKNFSNTAHVAAVMGWLNGTVTALLMGHPVTAVATGVGVPLTGAGLGRLLTNPQAARALVDISTAADQPAIQKAVNRLAVILIAHPELAQAFDDSKEGE